MDGEGRTKEPVPSSWEQVFGGHEDPAYLYPQAGVCSTAKGDQPGPRQPSTAQAPGSAVAFPAHEGPEAAPLLLNVSLQGSSLDSGPAVLWKEGMGLSSQPFLAPGPSSGLDTEVPAGLELSGAEHAPGVDD